VWNQLGCRGLQPLRRLQRLRGRIGFVRVAHDLGLFVAAVHGPRLWLDDGRVLPHSRAILLRYHLGRLLHGTSLLRQAVVVPPDDRRPPLWGRLHAERRAMRRTRSHDARTDARSRCADGRA